jgi:hypothetical protein
MIGLLQNGQNVQEHVALVFKQEKPIVNILIMICVICNVIQL